MAKGTELVRSGAWTTAQLLTLLAPGQLHDGTEIQEALDKNSELVRGAKTLVLTECEP